MLHCVSNFMCYWTFQKNILCAMKVLKQMEEADVKPDAMTFSYLISSSHNEKGLMKVAIISNYEIFYLSSTDHMMICFLSVCIMIGFSEVLSA